MHVTYNLLHLVPNETGGAETYARRLLPALRQADPALRMTLFLSRTAASEDWGDGVEVVPLRFDPRSRVRRVLAEQTVLSSAVRRAEPDLLHNVFNTAPALVSNPQVTTIHDVIHRRHPDSGLLALGVRAAVPLAAHRSARILTVSEASKTDIVRFLGVPADRVDVALNGPGIRENLQGPPEAEIRRRFEIADAPLVLTVAPSRPHKNVPRLVEALADVPDAVLVLPGYTTGGDAELDRLAKGLGVADRLRRPGWVDAATLDGLYRAADCFVLPSLAEGFGLPVLEAMLRGAPVACSNATSLPEVAGEAALYFDPLDTGAIAVSIQRILEDAELAEALRAAGRERARRFSWEESARRTLACYAKAVR
ncbi:MAG TPA: glycosyltransferase family 1 protein [Gaiellaceae bacterium]|nr:glycosyltransferase family 1 protein [Gaiellaceae bacterium]